MPLRFGATLCVAALAASLQSLHAQRSMRIRWPLVDFLVRGDTARPLMFAMSFNSLSRRDSTFWRHGWALFDPAEAFQWATLMTRSLDSMARTGSVMPTALLGPGLWTLSGDRFLGIAVDPRQRDRWLLLMTDSTGTKGYRAAASVRELATLLTGLGAMAEWGVRPGGLVPARIASEDRPCPAERLYLEQAPVDTEPEMIVNRALVLRYPERELKQRQSGQVWLELVADSLGRVDPATACVVFSDGAGFTAEVLRIVPDMRFRPAVRAGRRVDRLVLMPFEFRARRF